MVDSVCQMVDSVYRMQYIENIMVETFYHNTLLTK